MSYKKILTDIHTEAIEQKEYAEKLDDPFKKS